MSTAVWLSSAVLYVSVFFVGIVVLRGINVVMTPPNVSSPRLSGVTSSNKQVFDFAAEHTGLQRGAHRYHLVRIDALVRLFARQAAYQVLDHRHTRGAAYQNHFTQIAGSQSGVLQRRLERFLQPFDQNRRQLFELAARQRKVANASAPCCPQ